MRNAFAAALAVISLAGCASIMHGSNQRVEFASTPVGAQVSVDNKPLGITPTHTTLSRDEKHMVRIELAGYQPYEVELKRGVSGWVFGNIVFGGIPGVVVDAVTGAMYKLSPSEVNANLAGRTSATTNGDQLTIAVVLSANPSWEKIGQMTPAADFSPR